MTRETKKIVESWNVWMELFLSDQERVEVLVSLMERYCRDCGRILKDNETCQCENDE